MRILQNVDNFNNQIRPGFEGLEMGSLWSYPVIIVLKRQIHSYQPIRTKETHNMTEPIRISIEDARQKVSAGAALLVCAYDDDEKFKNNNLQGAISLNDFRAKLPSLSTEQEIIFYCA